MPTKAILYVRVHEIKNKPHFYMCICNKPNLPIHRQIEDIVRHRVNMIRIVSAGIATRLRLEATLFFLL